MDNNLLSSFLKFEGQENKIIKTNNEIVEPVKEQKPILTPTNFSSNEITMFNQAILEQLELSVGEVKFNTYFRDNLHILNLTEKELIFTVSTPFLKKVIESTYLSNIDHAILQTFGKKLSYSIDIINQSKEQAVDQSNRKPSKVSEMSFKLDNVDLIQSQSSKPKEEVVSEFFIDKNKKFENFIVGASNNLAYASCEAVANKPGTVYPSLYLHSASGLGKTHLLHAIANRIKEIKPDFKICFVTGNDFVTDYVNAVYKKEFHIFQKKYVENTDVLIIDDVHGLKSKVETQNTFFNIFEELHKKGKQLIFTSDKPPKEINGLEERVKTRLCWGLIVDIQQPDLETRIAILKQKANEKDFFLPEDVVTLIASAIKSNVRELEASLIKLGMYSSVSGMDIDIEIAKEQLKFSEQFNTELLNLDSIIKSVANYFKLTVNDIKSQKRTKDQTLARHIGMYLSNKLIKPTLSELGEFYGKRDHTTVMHAIKKIESQIKINQQLAHAILEIENTL